MINSKVEALHALTKLIDHHDTHLGEVCLLAKSDLIEEVMELGRRGALKKDLSTFVADAQREIEGMTTTINTMTTERTYLNSVEGMALNRKFYKLRTDLTDLYSYLSGLKTHYEL